MRRDVLLLEEMIEAAVKASQLVEGATVGTLAGEHQRRDAMLWNFPVLGEASAQLSAELKQRFPEVPWQQPSRLRNRIVHGYWSIDLEILHTTAQDQLPDFVVELGGSWPRSGLRTASPDLGLDGGAGDENRTRTVSLGS